MTEPPSDDNQASQQRRSVLTARLAVSSMFLANGFAFATWASRIPFVQQNLSLTPSVLGFALLMMGLGALAAMQLVASLIARYGSNRVTSVTCVATAAALFAIPQAHDVFQLGAVLFAFGVSSGGMDVAMNANAVAVERFARKSVMSSFHALWSLGSMAGALLGGAFACADLALHLHFSIVSGVIVVFGLIGYRCLIGDQVLLNFEPLVLAASGTSTITSKGISISMLAVICLLSFLSEGAIADWSALYMARSLYANAGLAAMALTSFSVTMAVGRLVGDCVIEALGDVRVLFFGALTTIVGVLLATVFQHPNLALVGFMLCGLGLSVQVPITFRLAGQAATHDAGSAIATVARAGYLGLLLGPPILGIVAQQSGLRASIAILALFALTTAILTFRLRARAKV